MGFWAVQRIQDDLIRITQQSRDPLFVAFMSISETHDRVNRQILREILHKSSGPSTVTLQQFSSETASSSGLPAVMTQQCTLGDDTVVIH